MKFDQVKKKSFDQTQNLTETFDQVKRSSEIRSSDCFPYVTHPLAIYILLIHYALVSVCLKQAKVAHIRKIQVWTMLIDHLAKILTSFDVLLVMERTDSDENFLTISKFQMCQ